jgi:plasmid stabilization system protein ParE
VYRLEYLALADLDMAEAEDYLFEHSPSAYHKFREAIKKQEPLLANNPLMYQVYDGNSYFRHMALPYEYLCFYHVDEEAKLITIHRILRGMRDIPNVLQPPGSAPAHE